MPRIGPSHRLDYCRIHASWWMRMPRPVDSPQRRRAGRGAGWRDSNRWRSGHRASGSCMGRAQVDDLAVVALRAVPFMLEGYRESVQIDADPDLEARIVWRHVQLG